MPEVKYSTGIAGFDKLIDNLSAGDNVVFRVDSIEDYIPFAEALAAQARSEGKKVLYFRFANHRDILSEDYTRHVSSPDMGFESFITGIHQAIASVGEGGFFIFDSLSDITQYCMSDRMIGNFFRLTCPYLYELKTIAYFAFYRNAHSYHATLPISETTQILIDVYRKDGKIFIQPAKVTGRYRKEMFMLHGFEGEALVPVRESARISGIILSSPWPGLPSASYRTIGVWDKLFLQAEAAALADAESAVKPFEATGASRTDLVSLFKRLIRLVITRDERMAALAEKYFTLQGLIGIWKRMIGTGMIGGKSAGMLLARAILVARNPRWKAILEEHDSFFIGSDVFYTFIVENGCWRDRLAQKNPASFLDGIEAAQERILKGNFPDYIMTRFQDMLDYYGQSPIIVRSSSLLEDNFMNAFAGKYESIFLANQGTREERLSNFVMAVKTVYASTMSEEALRYRRERGVLSKDEQMALLVQRVSGASYGRYFFPQLAGVAFSFNPYAWSRDIDPEAGMLRLVYGLGTRAVNRSDDDYTRVVALNDPFRRPEANFDEVKRYSQHRADVLDLETDSFVNLYVTDILKRDKGLPLDLFATRDRVLERFMIENELSNISPYVLTFDRLLKDTPFIGDMREMLSVLKEVYGVHVDVEFTANFLHDSYCINLLQCRPFQVQAGPEAELGFPVIETRDIIIEAHGGVIGHSRAVEIERIVFVRPGEYSILPEAERYALARFIGRLMRDMKGEGLSIILIGPGRWGTSTPSLGVPVTFSEISPVSVLCEIDVMHEGLVPDLSLGTHFFNEMVEMNMQYVAYFSAKKENVFNTSYFETTENDLLRFFPDAERWKETVLLIDTTRGQKVLFVSSSLEQKAVLYTSP
ncbi:MAG TPA: PEP/pyruvate-binding domain-containing protein [Spirochaetia bacterium]|nr:PEP/pyruvate-binding domain-containing protein [Spirochaetia bacterium]